MITTAPARHACPECGDAYHLYARADVKWNPEIGGWVATDCEDEVECTECDWSGPMNETEAGA